MTRALTSIFTLLAIATAAACGGDDAGDVTPDAALDAASGPIPALGLWRLRVDGTLDACEVGLPGKYQALPQQAILEVTDADSDTLALLDGRGNEITSGCTVTGAGTYDCPWTNGRPFNCDASRDTCTFVSEDGNAYQVSRHLTFSFASSEAATVHVTSSVTCVGGGTCASAESCLDDATYTFTPFVETQDLTPLDCSDEPSLAGGFAGTETYVDFVNTTSAPVIRYWIDWDGNRLAYPALAAGSRARQPTATNHYWLIEQAGACLGIYTPTADVSIVTIE